MLEFKNVTYIYNPNTIYEKKALDNINIKIDEGQIIGLIGKSGSGKSTFVQNLSGLIKPTSGKIFTDNKKIGFVFQYPEHQIFEMTVKNEIEFALKNQDEKSKSKLVLDALNAVGLSEDYLNKNPFELSGGEKRKVAIASILVMQPEILILDEPTVGLDFRTQQNILSYIKKIHDEKKLTVIIISHNMNIIAELTQKTIVMDNSKIIFYGKTCDAFNIPNINLPDSKKLINLLNARGFQIPDDIITFDDTVKIIAKKLKETKN